MKKSPYLRFLNHASFLIESDNSIILFDPWFSGSAFNNGWSLLDNTIKDEELIQELSESNKKIFIWYSHEHSDHLSFYFLKKLISSKINYTILFHETYDKRVVKNLSKKGFKVKEQKDNYKYYLDNEISIVTWNFGDNIDSYSLININEVSILNLNDCVINNELIAQKINSNIKKHTKNLDIVFTQFGYANWISNEEDKKEREIKAIEKNKRIFIQNKFLNPKTIIPFASFIYFSNYDNFFINDLQNTPLKLRRSKILENIQDKIMFMKPNNEINLNSDFVVLLKENTKEAEKYWNKLFDSIKPKNFKEDSIYPRELVNLFKKYRLIASIKLILLPQIMEIIGLIRPIKIYLRDIDTCMMFSWINEPKVIDDKSETIISISSNCLNFTLTNDYGIDCLSVNGRFRENHKAKFIDLERFLMFQSFIQSGITISNPIRLISKILKGIKLKYLS